VWANTIATVLVALSGGYWLGGRLADRSPRLESLCRVALAAAVLLAAVPFVASPFLRISADALDSVSAGAFLGSLVGVLALVAVPVLLLGAVSPFAVKLSVDDLGEAGRVTGRLYALSTVGSLAGTFLSALLLIPLVGTRRTFLVFAVALAVVAVVGLRPRLRPVPLALAALLFLPVGTTKAETSFGRVIHEEDTEYQYARVVEAPNGARRLELNEGHAVHSLYRPGRWLTGDYWDEFLVAPFATRATPPRRIAILGDAAGTTARAYGHFFPRTRVDGVEIDPALTAIGRRFFDLRGPRLHLYAEDARPFLRRARPETYDLIMVDAYRQPYIPFYLVTREFFALARAKLAPGGVLAINVGHPEGSDRLERALAATLRTEFARVLRDPVAPTNVVLLAAPGPLSARRLGGAAARLPGPLVPVAATAAARMAPAPRGGPVWTDDRAPVEWLIDTSILRYAEDGGR
jgi:spermidine synthase